MENKSSFKIVVAILAVAVVAVSVYSLSGSSGTGALRGGKLPLNLNNKADNAACGVEPFIAFTGSLNLEGIQRGLYGVQISGGSFQNIKTAVEKGCHARVLISDAAFRTSDIYECSAAQVRSSSFECHAGQTNQISQSPFEANPSTENLADTYIRIAETGDKEFSMRTEGWIQDGSRVEPFNSPALQGAQAVPNAGIVNVYISQ